ncbi:PTS system sucrose-specific IIBC component [Spiroplasma clarkii]|uniref:PTS system, sucrose-specific IIB component n=1 Tax=Spiroplasma clarkii TaxID=2139 RepID=A0A1Y0KZK6_9MOLU|nr:PTS transporter subunit EIIB [Spiroplasma clarkii]ARU90970.1 PTS system sucrose-specific IIBC component [Spiroplasma clarkii]ATX70412.1 PTS system, sucrose-specific IIB component [Spiroplasma clarkii]
MSKDSKQIVTLVEISQQVGGENNVKDVYHCATRMRITLNDSTLANLENLKAIPIIKGALFANGELQLIIGAEVSRLTSDFKNYLNKTTTKPNNGGFVVNAQTDTSKFSIWKKLLKSVSAIFGPLIPFLIGVGLILALQQLLYRAGAVVIPDYGNMTLGVDYNLFDYILDVIAGTGFKMMGVIAMWSTVRYCGGKTPTALALGLIMISPVLIGGGVLMFSIGNWDIKVGPYYSTMLVFIVMGVLVAYGQKTLEKYLHPVANFILNPLATLLVGGLLAFFVMGPIMGIVENAMLVAFNWFMTLPIGIGTMIVGLTWQPLVVLGVHNILFFAAVTAMSSGPSLFLAAAFAAAWAQMGATIGVALKSQKNIDRSAAIAAAVPGIISGPTESCIYAVNLPKGLPFITGTIAGAIGGWLIGIFGVDLDNLAGLGGIVGFLAYTDDLVAAILIDLGSFALGIGLTYLLWVEHKSEKLLALKTLKYLNSVKYFASKNDFQAIAAKKSIKKILGNRKNLDLANELKTLQSLANGLQSVDSEACELIKNFTKNYDALKTDKDFRQKLNNKLVKIESPRQANVNNTYEAIKKDIVNLKQLAPAAKAYGKLTARNENLDFTLNRLLQIKATKQAKLDAKLQKQLASLGGVDEKTKMMMTNLESWKQTRINDLNQKILDTQKSMDEKEKLLQTEISNHYGILVKQLEEFEKITNENLTEFKNRFFNDLHDKEIKAERI